MGLLDMIRERAKAKQERADAEMEKEYQYDLSSQKETIRQNLQGVRTVARLNEQGEVVREKTPLERRTHQEYDDVWGPRKPAVSERLTHGIGLRSQEPQLPMNAPPMRNSIEAAKQERAERTSFIERLEAQQQAKGQTLGDLTPKREKQRGLELDDERW